MPRNVQHDLLTTPDADVRARMRFVVALKREVEGLRRRSRALYDARIKPSMDAAGVPPEDQDDWVLEHLYREPLYQSVCTLKLAAQDAMWSAVADAIAPEAERLSRAFRDAQASPSRRGSLTLDPSLAPPRALVDTWVHRQPGGYFLDEGPDDVRAGALYEEGGAVYSMGQGVGTGESKAEVVQRFIRERHPAFRPRRILDIGCSAGASATPYATAFPDAEVHAIDVAPGLLRYAHARAEALGCAVHFHQMDAARLSFEDESFDLVTSHNAMHEMSRATQEAMFRESYRVLKPGGLCVHQDIPLRFSAYDVFDRAEKSFDYRFNGEVFWLDYALSDCAAMLAAAGFPPSDSYCGLVPQLDGTMSWFVASATKPESGVNG